MPTWGFILLGILAVLLLVLFLPITLRLYYNGTICLKVQILLFHILLYPRRKKTIRAQDFTEKSLKKRSEKLKKKAAKAAAKKQKKAANKEKSGKKEKNVQQPSTIEQIMEQLPLLLKIAKGVILRFCRYLRVHTVSFRLVVASSDAAATALWYGAAAAALDTLLGLLDTLKTTRRADRHNISVSCDFCAENPFFSCDLRFSLRLWQLIAIALGALRTYLRVQLKKEDDSAPKSPEKERAQAAARASVLEEITAK